MNDLRYPVGKFEWDGKLTPEQKAVFIGQIEETPAKMRAAVKGLSNEQLDTPYRPEGWTVRQVVHHLPDSHMNAYIRFKLAVTEDEPLIKTYDEKRWALLEDARTAPIEPSLNLLDSLHQRLVFLLKSLKPKDFERKLKHPELGVVSLDKYLSLYAWHGRHHVAHITSLRERMGWS